METADHKSIMKKVTELMDLICQSKDYQQYQKDLSRIKDDPTLMGQLNEFRRQNLELQLDESDPEYLPKEEALYVEYQEFLREPAVIDFMASEQRVCRLMREVSEKMYDRVEIDVSYMND